MHRHELSDSQYARLGPFLPELRHQGKAGRPWLPHRTVVNGILWILRTGAPGAICPNATASGTPSTRASSAGVATAPGLASSRPCSMNVTTKGSSTMIYGASTAPSSMPPVAPAAPDGTTVAARAWTKDRRRNWKSRKTMRWATRGAASRPRFTCCAIAGARCSASMPRPANVMKAGRSSRPCNGCICRVVGAVVVGHVGWPATRGTATLGSGVG